MQGFKAGEDGAVVPGIRVVVQGAVDRAHLPVRHGRFQALVEAEESIECGQCGFVPKRRLLDGDDIRTAQPSSVGEPVGAGLSNGKARRNELVEQRLDDFRRRKHRARDGVGGCHALDAELQDAVVPRGRGCWLCAGRRVCSGGRG